MTDDEAQSTGEFQMRHSHATHDLFNAIAAGDYPEYDFYIQTLDPADELSLDFDPLDCTKVGRLPPILAPFCLVITGMRDCSGSLALLGSVSFGLLYMASHATLAQTGSFQSR